MAIFGEDPRCPYCNQQLDKTPARKVKCPHCGEFIYVRQGKLITEEEAQISEWLGYLDQFDITRSKFDQERKKLSERFKTKASVHDTVWSILNKWVGSHPAQRSVEFAYREMARLLSQEGKDCNHLIESALTAQLQFYKIRKVKNVIVQNYGGRGDNIDTCPQCAELHGKKFTIDEALNKMPIPRNCTSDFECRCYYEPATIEEEVLLIDS